MYIYIYVCFCTNNAATTEQRVEKMLWRVLDAIFNSKTRSQKSFDDVKKKEKEREVSRKSVCVCDCIVSLIFVTHKPHAELLFLIKGHKKIKKAIDKTLKPFTHQSIDR